MNDQIWNISLIEFYICYFWSERIVHFDFSMYLMPPRLDLKWLPRKNLLKFSFLRLNSIKLDFFHSMLCIVTIRIYSLLRMFRTWNLTYQENATKYLARKCFKDKLEPSSIGIGSNKNWQTCFSISIGKIHITLYRYWYCHILARPGRHFLRDFLRVCILYEIFLVRKFRFL